MLLYMERTTPIAAAVEPLRAAAVDYAAKSAAALAERALAAYEADPESINPPLEKLCAMGRTERALHSARVARIRSLCVVKGGKFVRDAKKLADFIEAARDAANRHYTSFIEKLEKKVGPHLSASLEGNHVWSSSVLTVTKTDGGVTIVTEKWFTQQIDNISVLGRPFLQWPSRKVK
jgi:hypothetical protein